LPELISSNKALAIFMIERLNTCCECFVVKWEAFLGSVQPGVAASNKRETRRTWARRASPCMREFLKSVSQIAAYLGARNLPQRG
jgi:hypothetical protein